MLVYTSTFVITAFATRRSGAARQVFFESSASLVAVSVLWMLYRPSYSLTPSFDLWWAFALTLVVEVSIFRSERAVLPKWFLRDPMVLVSVTVLSPIAEEMFFRGLVLHFTGSALWSSVIFSLFHVVNLFGFERFSLGAFVFRFVLGLIFAVATLSSGSLFPAVFYHVVNNTLTVVLMLR